MDSSIPPAHWVPREITLTPSWGATNSDDIVTCMQGYISRQSHDDDGAVIYWEDEASDEELLGAIYGWHMRALNAPSSLRVELIGDVLHHRMCLRGEFADPDEAAQLNRMVPPGDEMMPGYMLTNSGIEEDSLARIYLRVLRVHDFVTRFTGDEELDGLFNPEGIHRELHFIRDELLLDVFNWLYLHDSYRDGSVIPTGYYPDVAERRVADESEAIRRQFGYLETFCAEHPGETQLRLRLEELQAHYREPLNTPVEKIRRKRGYKPLDAFWTADRIQAALDLGMEN